MEYCALARENHERERERERPPKAALQGIHKAFTSVPTTACGAIILTDSGISFSNPAERLENDKWRPGDSNLFFREG